MEWEIRDGEIILSIDPTWLAQAQYPVEIDPPLDLQVGASADDDTVYRVVTWNPPSNTYWSTTGTNLAVGNVESASYGLGSSMRFTGVNIPAGATMTVDASYLTLIASTSLSGTTVRSDLCAENSNNPGQMVGYADHIGRTRTTPVPWDSIAGWTSGAPYQSPYIHAPIQQVVDDQAGTGDALIIIWEDKDLESSAGAYRSVASFDHVTLAAPTIHIEYTAGGGPTERSKSYTVDALLKALDVDKTYSTDTLLQKQDIDKSYTVDSLIKKLDIDKTYILDTLVKKLLVDKEYSLDTLIKLFDIDKTYIIDTLLKLVDIDKSYNLNTLLKALDIDKSFFIDTLLKKLEIDKEYSIDFLIKLFDIDKSYYINILLIELGISKSYSIDTILRTLYVEYEKTYSIDTLLLALNVSKSYAIDILFSVINITKSYSADVILFLSALKSYSLDTVLIKHSWVKDVSGVGILSIDVNGIGISEESVQGTGTSRHSIDGIGDGRYRIIT